MKIEVCQLIFSFNAKNYFNILSSNRIDVTLLARRLFSLLRKFIRYCGCWHKYTAPPLVALALIASDSPPAKKCILSTPPASAENRFFNPLIL
jgi:hypothetical protein